MVHFKDAVSQAQDRFFNENLKLPNIIVVNPDGWAMVMEELASEEGIDLLEGDVRYEDMDVAVCTHSKFPMFVLSYGSDR